MRIASLALLTLALAAAGCGGGGDKAGGSGGPVTLRIGTDDVAGRPATAAIQELAGQARALSGGRIRLVAVYQAGGKGVHDWDQRVARRVKAGGLEMGMIPARAWDTEGVTTLRALQAPFLVTSDRLVGEIVTGGLARPLLAGLGRAGVVGLGLVPEGLRHPFAFGHPLLSPADFAGASIRTPRSDVAFALYRALGAVPSDPVGGDFARGVAAGAIAAADSSFLLAPSSVPRLTVATANITPYPKVDAVVVNRRAWERLPEGDRALLREAVRRTVAHVIAAGPPEAVTARRFCAEGGQVVLAPAADVAALRAAAAPVYAELARDPATEGLIARIRELARRLGPGAPPKPCSPPPDAAGGQAIASEAHVLDGVWRSNPSYADGIAAGVPPDVAAGEMGLQTIQLAGGSYDWRWRSRNGEQRCRGTYTVTRDVVVFTDGAPCSGQWDVTFRLAGRAIHWGRVHAHTADPVDQRVWGRLHAKPWRRLDAPAFPEGVYRANVPPGFLVAHGVDAGDAENNGGLQTQTFSAGRWLGQTAGNPTDPPDCPGTYTVSGEVLNVYADARPECGTAAGGLLFSAVWSLRGDALRLTAVRDGDGDSVLSRTLWGGRPWRKIR